MPEARGDIAVRPKQIGCAGLGIVARADQSSGIRQAVLATDSDDADAFGRIDRRAIGKRQQREPRSWPMKASVKNAGSPASPEIGASGIDAPGRGPPRQTSLSGVESGES